MVWTAIYFNGEIRTNGLDGKIDSRYYGAWPHIVTKVYPGLVFLLVRIYA